MIAYLQPFLNPGSNPMIVFPLTGGDNKSCFKLEENTSTEAVSAIAFSFDLKDNYFSFLGLPPFLLLA